MSNFSHTHPLAESLMAQEPFLRRLARALLRDEHAAEDLVQDTLTAALTRSGMPSNPSRKALEDLSPGRLRAWLTTVLRNTSIDGHRVHKSAPSESEHLLDHAPGASASPEEIALRLERQRLLHNGLLAIPEELRTILVLRYQDGLSLAAIAQSSDTPLPTVKSRAYKGLQLLKEELDRSSGGDADARSRWLAAVAGLAHPATRVGPAPLAASGVATKAGATTVVAAALWKPVALGWLALGLVGLAAIALRPGSDPHLNSVAHQEVRPEAQAQGAHVPGQDAALANALEGSGARQVSGLQPPLGSAPYSGTFTGKVVSAMSGEPVPAQAHLGPAPITTASFQSGEYLVTATEGGETTLRLTHPRFEPLEVSLAEEDNWERRGSRRELRTLEMMPKTRARLRVLDEGGRPVSGADCFLSRSLGRVLEGRGPGPSELDRARPIGTTDIDGWVHFPLAYSAAVSVRDKEGRLALGQATGGASSVLRIGGPARTLVVRDVESGQPVAGRAFPIGWQHASAEVGLFVWTDGQGRADLPVGAGMLTVCKAEPRLLLSSMRVGQREVQGVRDGAFQAAVRVAAEETVVTVQVRNNEVDLRLVDRSTGEPVEGLTYFQEQYLSDQGEWSGVAVDTPTLLQAGVLKAHRWFTDAQPPNSTTQNRRFLLVPGYKPEFLDGVLDLAGATIALDACESRSLRLVDPSGSPRTARGVLHVGAGVSVRFETGVDGLIGPFSWQPGEAWELVDFGSGTAGAPLEIAAVSLLEASVVTVVAKGEPGAVRVHGVPEDSPPLFAVAGGGIYSATRQLVPDEQRQGSQASEYVFQGLVPGNYAIGPKTWALQMLNRGTPVSALGRAHDYRKSPTSTLLLRVEPGAELEMSWDPRWSTLEPVMGTLVCAGKQSQELAALPIFGDGISPIHFGTETPWLYCDGSGRFQTAAGDPEPSAFLFAYFVHDVFGHKPVVIDSQQVREDGVYRVALTSYELVASNAEEWAAADVTSRIWPTLWHDADAAELGAPMEFITGAGFGKWDPSKPRVERGLPTHISSLRLTFRRSDLEVVVPIVAGGHTRVEVHVPLPQSGGESEAGPLLLQSR